jgi:hypothetical protein
VNSLLVAEGLRRCVTGITRNPALAKEVQVPLHSVATPELEPSDVVSLRVLTRIGTNPDGSKCSGHSNAVGLRLYYDAVSRASGFGVDLAPEPPTDYFLCGSSPTLLLDTAAPTSTSAKQKDSAAIKFAGGNPWALIGTWTETMP